MPSEPTQPFEIELPLEIKSYDIDFAGVVSNIVYIRWLEDLRGAMLSRQLPLERMLDSGLLPAVAQTRIDYKAPLRLFDRPMGRIWAKDMGEKYFLLEAEFTLKGQVVATAEQVTVFVDRDNWQPAPMPPALAQMYAQQNDQSEN